MKLRVTIVTLLISGALGTTVLHGDDRRHKTPSLISVDAHGQLIRRDDAAPSLNQLKLKTAKDEAQLGLDEARLSEAKARIASKLPDLGTTAQGTASTPTSLEGASLAHKRLAVIGASLAILIAMGWRGFQHWPGTTTACLYLCTSVGIDACIATSHLHATEEKGAQQTFAFNPLCNIMLVELGKLLVSTVLFALSQMSEKQGIPLQRQHGLLSLMRSIKASSSAVDVAWMAIPALLYTVNNMLVFAAIGHNEVATFAAFRETILLWTALIWMSVFKVSLGWKRVVPLFTIMCGLVLNQVPPLMHASFSWTIVFVLAMALTNATASVCNEYVLKRRDDVDVNLQNMHLYSCCFLMAVLSLAMSDHTKLMSFSNFFSGFDTVTLCITSLQLVAGLLVSRLLKYTNSLQKTVVAAFRGPVLIGLSPLLGLQSRTDPLTLLSAAIVSASSFSFLMQGKPEMQDQKQTS